MNESNKATNGRSTLSSSVFDGNFCSTCGYIPCTCDNVNKDIQEIQCPSEEENWDWRDYIDYTYPCKESRIKVLRAYATFLSTEIKEQKNPPLKRQRRLVGQELIDELEK